MINKKKKSPVKFPTKLEEAKTIGYMEGYSDGKIELIKQLIKFKLLKNHWKTAYNKQIGKEGDFIL